jgi:hypothetical protein
VESSCIGQAHCRIEWQYDIRRIHSWRRLQTSLEHQRFRFARLREATASTIGVADRNGFRHGKIRAHKRCRLGRCSSSDYERQVQVGSCANSIYAASASPRPYGRLCSTHRKHFPQILRSEHPTSAIRSIDYSPTHMQIPHPIKCSSTSDQIEHNPNRRPALASHRGGQNG